MGQLYLAKCTALAAFDCWCVYLKKRKRTRTIGVVLLDLERFIADYRMANEEAGSQMACGRP